MQLRDVCECAEADEQEAEQAEVTAETAGGIEDKRRSYEIYD